MTSRVVILAALCAAAPAETLRTPGEAVLAELRDALRDIDIDRARALLAEAAAIHRHPASPEEARALLDAIAGMAVHGSDLLAPAAVLALGETGAPEAAEHVARHLRALRPSEGETLRAVAAARAAARLRADSLRAPLLALAAKCDRLLVAEQALLALGAWCDADRDTRARVLEDLLSLAPALDRAPAPRRARLSGPLLRALQRLSGRRLASADLIAGWWRIARTREDPFRAD